MLGCKVCSKTDWLISGTLVPPGVFSGSKKLSEFYLAVFRLGKTMGGRESLYVYLGEQKFTSLLYSFFYLFYISAPTG